MPTINIDFEMLTRDLADQYAKGLLSIDEYLDMMEEVCRRSVQPTVEG